MDIAELFYKIQRAWFWVSCAMGLTAVVGAFLLFKDPYFDVVCRPINDTIETEATTDCTIIPRSGLLKPFGGTVALSCKDLPDGITCQFDKPATPPSYDPVDMKVKVRSGEAHSGRAEWTVVGKSDDMVRTTPVSADIK